MEAAQWVSTEGMVDLMVTVDGSTERDWLEAAREGDLAAFEHLYRATSRRIYAVCYRMTTDAPLAEELTQETFVRAWRKLSLFRGDSAFSSWVHAIAVNTVLSDRRARKRREARESVADEPSDLERMAEAPTKRSPETGIDLERAMALLPPGARNVFILHDVEGFRHEEIARMLGVAEGTSKAQLHRARRLLREGLGR